MAIPHPKPEIDTCNACGKLFPRVSMRLCTQCAINLENRFDIVREFLKDNHGAAIPTIAGATGVSHSDVRRFLDGGRLVEVAGGPDGPCTCAPGAPRCRACRNSLASKLRNLGTQMAVDIEDQDPVQPGPDAPGHRRPSAASEPADGRTSYVRRIRRIPEGD